MSGSGGPADPEVDPMVERIAGRVAAIRARIATAAQRAGRDGDAVDLVAATKTVPPDLVAAAVEAGVMDVGENRAQELVAKASALAGLGLEPRWHFLGQLQRNKVRSLAPWVQCWQSVDREPLGDEVAARAPGARVLVEVNLAGEPAKAGCAPATLASLVEHLRNRGLVVAGLMAIPPAQDAPRRWFAGLRELAEAHELIELSMGMSEDFEVAVEEGATMVRVGRVLFGPRPT